MKNFFEKFLHSLNNNLRYFPIATVIAYSLTILLILLVLDNFQDSNLTPKIISTLILGYFLFTALHLLKKTLYLVVGALALGGYFLYYSQLFATKYFIYQSIYLIVASIFFIFLAPFLGKRALDDEVYEWVRWVGYSLSSAILLSTLLILAISLAFGAIELLLGLRVGGDFYAITTIFIFGVFGANYFLEQLRTYDSKSKILNHKLYSLISKYILPAFTIFYLVILYLYTAKIIFTASWPEGGVAWFILTFTLITFSAHFNLIPYKKDKLQKLLLIAIIPQAFVLLLAVYKRIEAYSFTESRYMLIVYGVFLILISLYFILRRGATYRDFFIGAVLIILLSQIGFTSGYYISKIAQTNRLKVNLELFNDGNHSSKLKKDISSSLYYLIHRYGIDGVGDVLPEIVKKYKSTANNPLFPKSSYNADIESFVAKEIGFKYSGKGYSYKRENDPDEHKHFYCKREYFSSKGFDWTIIDDVGLYTKKSKESYTIKELNNLKVVIKRDKIIIKDTQIDLKEYVKSIFKAKGCEEIEPFEYQDENIKLKLILKDSLNIQKEYLESIYFILLFSVKK